jgi:hypothetical protein
MLPTPSRIGPKKLARRSIALEIHEDVFQESRERQYSQLTVLGLLRRWGGVLLLEFLLCLSVFVDGRLIVELLFLARQLTEKIAGKFLTNVGSLFRGLARCLEVFFEHVLVLFEVLFRPVLPSGQQFRWLLILSREL